MRRICQFAQLNQARRGLHSRPFWALARAAAMVTDVVCLIKIQTIGVRLTMPSLGHLRAFAFVAATVFSAACGSGAPPEPPAAQPTTGSPIAEIEAWRAKHEAD